MSGERELKKEWIFNIAFNRWQLNRPKYVGRLSEAIRACAPKTEEAWREYYMHEVPKKHIPSDWQRLGETMAEQLISVGERLYVKISENLQAEVEAISKEDCIAYVEEVVIRRTFEGYLSEKQTVHEQLKDYLIASGFQQLEIRPAPAEWEGSYQVDFYIPLSSGGSGSQKYIGIQIKPITYNQFAEKDKCHEWMKASHECFFRDFGGRVYILFSYAEKGQKVIANREVLDEIASDMKSLLQKEESAN